MTISIKPTASGSTIEQDGSTILTVDGSGNITPSNDLYPKVPAFSARLSTTQTVSDNVITKIAFDIVDIDTHSAFDNTTNYRFTVPSGYDGIYHINGHVRVDSNASDDLGRARLHLYKNGTVIALDYTLFNTNYIQAHTLNIHTILNLVAGDYLELYADGNSIANSNIDFDSGVYTNFSGYLVSV
jgi:hypothetical protein